MVARTALVGVPSPAGTLPVLCIELAQASANVNAATLFAELRELGAKFAHTAAISRFLIHPGFPVDVRHNAKINREQLATWATKHFHPQITQITQIQSAQSA